MNYPKWQGPALSKADREAYENYCRWCRNIWLSHPPTIEQYVQHTKMISASPSPYLAERGVSMISKF